METNNEKVEFKKMVNGKSYPAVLIDVISEYDPIIKAYVVRFIYKVYLSASQTEEVVENFYMWDYHRYKGFTFERLDKVLSAYNLNLIYKDYRNEMKIVNACKWLVGTLVEIKQYRYKGVKYKVLSTERNEPYRIELLWKCMLKNDLGSFPEILKSEDEILDELLSEIHREKSSESLNETFDDPFEGFRETLYDESFDEIKTSDDLLTPEAYQELEFKNRKKRR